MDEKLERAWRAELYPGRIVAYDVSGHSGEIRSLHFGNGERDARPWIDVWNLNRGYEREEWSLAHIALRRPRTCKRWPRPFRYARLTPTFHCHCPRGKLIVKGPHDVICNRCGCAIGSESYPDRFQEASRKLAKVYGLPEAKASEKRILPAGGRVKLVEYEEQIFRRTYVKESPKEAKQFRAKVDEILKRVDAESKAKGWGVKVMKARKPVVRYPRQKVLKRPDKPVPKDGDRSFAAWSDIIMYGNAEGKERARLTKVYKSLSVKQTDKKRGK